MAKKRAAEPVAYEPPNEIASLAETKSFSGHDLLAAVGRAVMARHTKKLYAHLPGVLTGDDPHDIHQMRVATRRLRASLQATAAAYRPETVTSLRRHLRRVARALGEVRDRDVLLMRLREDASKLATDTSTGAEGELGSEAEHDELQQAIEQIQNERDGAHTDLVKELARKRTSKLLNEINQFLTCPLEDVQADDDGRPLLVHHHAGSMLWREYEAVRRFETVIHDASSEQLHNLRIACKYLRYTIELFEPALGEEVGSTLQLVTTMQEHLGNLHDADVAIDYLRSAQRARPSLAGSPNRSDEATPGEDENQQPFSRIARYIDMRLNERSELLAGVQPLWQQLVDEDTRRRLGRMIAEL